MTIIMILVGMLAFVVVSLAKNLKSGAKAFGFCVLVGLAIDITMFLFGCAVLVALV